MEINNTLSFPAVDSFSGIDVNETEQVLQSTRQGSESVVLSSGPSHFQDGGKTPVLDAPKEAMVDFAVALMEAQSKLNQQQLEYSKNDIEAISVKNEAAHAERVSALEETIEKMAKAEKGGLFGKVFGWIATIATCVAAVAATAVSGGAAAPLMLAAGLMLVQQISSECGSSLTGLMAKGLEAIGVSEKAAQIIADVAFAVTVVALSCGAGIASAMNNAAKTAMSVTKAVMNSGMNAAKSSANLIKAASNMMDDAILAAAKAAAKQSAKAAQTSAEASSTAKTAANAVDLGARVTSGASQVGQGASQAVATEARYDADMYRAEAKELAGFLAKMQALMNENTERVQELLERLQNSSSNIVSILNNHQQSHQLISQNIRA